MLPTRFALLLLAAAPLAAASCTSSMGGRGALSERAEALGRRQLGLLEQLRLRAERLEAAPQTPEIAARFEESKTLALSVWAVGQGTKAASRCGSAAEIEELEDATMRLAQRIGDD